MAERVTIVGAGGNVGRRVAEQLLADGREVRVVGRHADRLAALIGRGARPHIGDMQDADFLVDALRGSDAALVMLPQDFTVPDYWAVQRRALDGLEAALRSARVKRVVALTSIATDLRIGPGALHGEYEQRVMAASPDAALVCSAYLMENHLGAIPLVHSAGINGGGIRGDVTLPMAAARDVAAAIVELVRAPSVSRGTVREVFGPRDYSPREATAILGRAIGRPDLAYVEFPPESLRGSLIGQAGFAPDVADALVALQEAFNDGRVQATVRRAPANTTPTTLEEFAREVFAPTFAAFGVPARA